MKVKVLSLVNCQYKFILPLMMPNDVDVDAGESEWEEKGSES